MAKMIITIDGPAGSGKSTVAQLLAEKLGAGFLDTGAMYRAVTLAAMQAGVDMDNEKALLDVMERTEMRFESKAGEMVVFINGVDVAEQIRAPEVTEKARYIASAEKIREKLVQMQRRFAEGQGKIVTEGRDQGTAAFADADVKFYLTADIKERARRRQEQLLSKDINESIEQIERAIEQRDSSDIERAVGPLRQAADAIVIDTTEMDVEAVVQELFERVQERLKM